MSSKTSSRLALAARKVVRALAAGALCVLTAKFGIAIEAESAADSATTAQPLPSYQEILLPASTLAGVVPGPGGLLYGVTYEGGASKLGTIFSARPDLSLVTILHSFSGTDGRTPYSELTAGGSLLYGTTSAGGPGGGGTVFSFNPSSGTLTTLATFAAPYSRPIGPLLLIGDFLYGSTTSFPGGSSVFRLRTDGSEVPVFLHLFAASDGYGPGALTQGLDGYLYGTAAVGGLAGCYPSPYDGCGTVFRLRPDGTGFEVVYRFDSSTIRGRGFPERKLVVSSDGRLYGTTYTGVFSLVPNPAAPDFQVLYTVPVAQGSQIFAPPIEGLDGRLYINQYDGGDGLTNGVGSVYSMTKTGTDVLTHHLFTLTSGGQGPYGIMFQDAGGTIYGTTEYNAASPQAPYFGTLFAIRSLTPNPASQTTLASSLNPSSPGQAVTFTATVTPTGASGTITFSDNGVPLAAPVMLVTGSASVTTSTLALGSHSITAVYGGNATYQSSSASLTQSVVLPTTTTLTSSPNPSLVGQTVTFTATVSGGSNPLGNVVFRDGAAQLGVAPLVGSTAMLSGSALTAGTHQITARYSGNAENAESTSAPLAQVVNKVSLAVGLLSSKNPSKIGDAVTLTATLPADATGTIAFVDGGVEMISLAVAGGQAQTTTSALTIGSHSMIARYGGDAKYLPADSAPLVQTVNPLNSPPQIAPIVDQTVRWGQSLAFPMFANDIDGDPISFSLVNPPLGASITPSGQFSWTPTSAQVGATTITVEASDGVVVGSRSFTVTVQKHVTSAAYLQPLAAAPGPVELQATLVDTTDGVPLAGRTMVFNIGTQNVSAVTDATGSARASLLLAQPSGIVQVAVAYAGEAAYQPSSSFAQPFRISSPPVFAPILRQQVLWGRTLNVPFQVSDPEGDTVIVNLVSGPPGLLHNLNMLVWTPTAPQVGTASAVLRATDGFSTTQATVTIDVLPHPTAIIDLAPGAVGNGPLVAVATLVDAEFATPLTGKSLSFVVGAQTTSGVTDPWGAAQGKLTVAQPVGPSNLSASFAGELAYLPSSATRSLLIFGDTDGDGLRDDWEINGVDVDGNGSIDLDLPAMGANPLHKDLFVETDWMELPMLCLVAACVPRDGTEPQPAALQHLVAAYAAAPVANPDGTFGITLHVDAGPASLMNPLTGQTWGTLARGGRVPLDQELGTVDANFVYDWTEFDALKQVHFDVARRGVFRYVVYAHTLGDPVAAGISRGIPGSDVAMAAASTAWLQPNGFQGMTVTQERGILMHELGHNFGLKHGGNDDYAFKPNYNSIMNYSYVMKGVPPDGRADYSRVEEPAVDVVQPDGSIITLTGFNDWPALVYSGGGIGDRAIFPAPRATPIEHIDPAELRARDAWTREGDGLARFRGPLLLVRNSGVRNLIVDVANISDAPAQYVVALHTESPPATISAGVSLAPGQVVRVLLPVDTTGLPAGEYQVMLTLRSSAGDVLHQSKQRVVVLDLTDRSSADLARETAAALKQLPPDSGFDPAVVADILDMINDVLGSSSWQAVVVVTGGATFSTTFSIAEPEIGGFNEPIRAQSLPGEPEFDLDLRRAAGNANGRVRLRIPSGAFVDAVLVGRWNDATRTFEGKWVVPQHQPGSLTIQLRQP